MQKNDRPIPIAEIVAQRRLPFSIRTIRKLIASGELKAINMGFGKIPRWAILESEIDRFIKGRAYELD